MHKAFRMRALCFLWLAAGALPVLAQHDMPGHAGHDMGQMAGHDMSHMTTHSPGANGDPVSLSAMDQASGTSANPASSPMNMMEARIGRWDFLFHGVAFISDIQQTGPRGGDKFASMNWFMGSAEHQAGRGSIQFRLMLSLDPATVTDRRYPELFQTGETAFGKPIVDGQHPHDFIMESSVQYRRPVGEKSVLNLYLAPVGDPALGPAAFPHRVSAAELPQAPLSHHWQDSTHIANEVVTASLTRGIFRWEASGFHGAEPNENRWNIDHGAIDSWAVRAWVNPAPNWSGQVSVGRLHHPEILEPDDVVRATASLTYNKPLTGGCWATSLIWGRNHKTVAQRNTNSYLLESVYQFRHTNYLTGRVEMVDKDELFQAQPQLRDRLEETAGSTFRIIPYTLGYTRDVSLLPGLTTGFGANVTLYRVPAVIQRYYGEHPVSVIFYMRVRLAGSGPMQHSSHRS
ncbi:MAG TPA: hypothetical protein VFA54_11745, partial [Bryobacterales bacterium]|jgi:hypothetical protein|nr:hypothetical protein [Bryobacterales bacterium]